MKKVFFLLKPRSYSAILHRWRGKVARYLFLFLFIYNCSCSVIIPEKRWSHSGTEPTSVELHRDPRSLKDDLPTELLRRDEKVVAFLMD